MSNILLYRCIVTAPENTNCVFLPRSFVNLTANPFNFIIFFLFKSSTELFILEIKILIVINHWASLIVPLKILAYIILHHIIMPYFWWYWCFVAHILFYYYSSVTLWTYALSELIQETTRPYIMQNRKSEYFTLMNSKPEVEKCFKVLRINSKVILSQFKSAREHKRHIFVFSLCDEISAVNCSSLRTCWMVLFCLFNRIWPMEPGVERVCLGNVNGFKWDQDLCV